MKKVSSEPRIAIFLTRFVHFIALDSIFLFGGQWAHLYDQGVTWQYSYNSNCLNDWEVGGGRRAGRLARFWFWMLQYLFPLVMVNSLKCWKFTDYLNKDGALIAILLKFWGTFAYWLWYTRNAATFFTTFHDSFDWISYFLNYLICFTLIEVYVHALFFIFILHFILFSTSFWTVLFAFLRLFPFILELGPKFLGVGFFRSETLRFNRQFLIGR